nr:hypothetical protein [Bacteroidota bacterium]
ATVNPDRDVAQAVFFTITYHNDNEGWAEIGGEDFFGLNNYLLWGELNNSYIEEWK